MDDKSRTDHCFCRAAGTYDQVDGSPTAVGHGRSYYFERHVFISAARTRMERRHRRRYGTEMLSDSCMARDESDLHA